MQVADDEKDVDQDEATQESHDLVAIADDQIGGDEQDHVAHLYLDHSLGVEGDIGVVHGEDGVDQKH